MSGTFSISGIVSGIDWDSMVEKLVENASRSIAVQETKITNLTNKKTLLQEMQGLIQTLQSSLLSLKLPGTYNAKDLEIDRLDSIGSYKGVLTASVNANAAVAFHDITVEQLAMAQIQRSNSFSTTNGELANIFNSGSLKGLDSATFTISVAGVQKEITVNKADTIQALADNINTALKAGTDLGVTATVVDGRLVLSSDYTGLGEEEKTENLTMGVATNTIKLSDINVDVDLLSAGGAVFELSDGENEYTLGKDFDIVNTANGSEIRWRTSNSNSAKVGESYTVEYVAKAGDVWSTKIKRGDDEVDLDSNVLDITPDLDNGELTITDTNGSVYTRGDDFWISGTSIRWLTSGSARRPEEGSEYTVTYTVKKTTTLELDVPRTRTDEIHTGTGKVAMSDILANTTRGASVITQGSNRYYEGEDFNIVGDKNGNAAVQWRNEAGFNAPAAGSSYILTTVSSDGNETTVTYNMTRTADDEIKMADAGFTTANGYIKSVTLGDVTQNVATDQLKVTGNGTSITWDSSSVVRDGDEITIHFNAGVGTRYSSKDIREITLSGVSGRDKTDISSLADFKPDASKGTVYLRTITSESPLTFTTYDSNNHFTVNDDGTVTWKNGVSPSNGKYFMIYKPDEDVDLAITMTSKGAGQVDTIEGLEGFTALNATITSVTWADVTQDVTNGYSNFTAAPFANSQTVTLASGSGITSGDKVAITFTTDTGGYDYYNSIYNTACENGGEIRLTESGLNISSLINFNIDDSVAFIRLENGGTTYLSGRDFTLDKNGNVIWDSSVAGTVDTTHDYHVTATFNQGRTVTVNGVSDGSDAISLWNLGFTNMHGTVTSVQNVTQSDASKPTPTSDLAVTAKANGNGSFTLKWDEGTQTALSNIPEPGTELKATYTYRYNTFTLSDNGNGILNALGLDQYDDEHYTEAQDAILLIDGERIQKSYNNIGEAYDNEIEGLEGVTLKLKGTGRVTLDVSLDLSKATDAVNEVLENYNTLLEWINVRSTESAVDTESSDDSVVGSSEDFRRRWGLLHGSSLLRNAKSDLRSISSNNYSYTFSNRTSVKAMYGTLEQNGIKTDQTLTLKVGGKVAMFTIKPDMSLKDIVDMINDTTDSLTNPAYNLHYDDNGKGIQPLAKATLTNNKLTITASGYQGTEVAISGSSELLKAIGINYTYIGLYQVGIETTSTNYGSSGQLEFKESTFLEVAEENHEEFQSLMMAWANSLSDWTSNMLRVSENEYGSKGTLTQEISSIDSQISDLNEHISDFNTRMDQYRARLQTKFAAAESALAELMNQSSTLSSLTAYLPNYNNSNGSGSSGSSL